MRPKEKPKRYSGCSVSGRRSAIHSETASDSTSIVTKIRRQPPITRNRLPMPGAKIGTVMKIIITKDMTRAISRPAKRSRTIDTVMTRAAERDQEVVAAGEPGRQAGRGMERQAAEQHRASPPDIGERAVDHLHDGEAAHVGVDQQLQPVGIGDAELDADRREGRQQIVDR